MPRKHPHYFRNVAHLTEVDVYRVLDLFGVTDQALGHAIKKLLAPGGRGAGKDFRRDVQEAIDTLTRRLEMLDEDATAGTGKVCQITSWPPTKDTQPEPDFFASLATGDMELQAEAQHASTAPVVIPPAPDYLPDSVAVRCPELCQEPHSAANNTATLSALDVVAANAADDGWIEWGGGECPVPHGTEVQVQHRGGIVFRGKALLDKGMGHSSWHIGFYNDPKPDPRDIIAYRVVRSA